MSISSFYPHFIILIWVLITFCLKGYSLGFPGGASGKNLPANTGDIKGSISGRGRSLGKGMATHSSILARRNPWTEEPGGPWSIGTQRVGHN